MDFNMNSQTIHINLFFEKRLIKLKSLDHLYNFYQIVKMIKMWNLRFEFWKKFKFKFIFYIKLDVYKLS